MPLKDFLRACRRLLRWVLQLALSPVIIVLKATGHVLDYAATELEKV